MQKSHDWICKLPLEYTYMYAHVWVRPCVDDPATVEVLSICCGALLSGLYARSLSRRDEQDLAVSLTVVGHRWHKSEKEERTLFNALVRSIISVTGNMCTGKVCAKF